MEKGRAGDDGLCLFRLPVLDVDHLPSFSLEPSQRVDLQAVDHVSRMSRNLSSHEEAKATPSLGGRPLQIDALLGSQPDKPVLLLLLHALLPAMAGIYVITRASDFLNFDYVVARWWTFHRTSVSMHLSCCLSHEHKELNSFELHFFHSSLYDP